MKRIIDGKRYDTEKAEEIAWNGSTEGRSDFRYFSEYLYRTARGRWFLAGSGGPMTKYAETIGNGRTGGDGIIPLSEDEAREWLEHCDSSSATEALEKYFTLEDA
jgi:hypothetical protein